LGDIVLEHIQKRLVEDHRLEERRMGAGTGEVSDGDAGADAGGAGDYVGDDDDYDYGLVKRRTASTIMQHHRRFQTTGPAASTAVPT
jgi:hypothetical protein